MTNVFDSFGDLPEQLQLEAIREGELMLQAQLSIASSADQRALTWSGFLLAGATATVGAGFSALKGTPPNGELGALALSAGGALLLACWFSISTVKPSLFGLPGNRPRNWLPDQWSSTGSHNMKIRVARREQAECLDRLIDGNAEAASEKALAMHRSFGLALFTVFASGVCLFLMLIA